MAKKSSSDGTKTKKNKKKSNKRSGPNAVAMKQKAPQPNPFETIWSRRKFDILGKKRKGEQRRIGLARSLAIEKRKKTLLKEYEQSGKSSVFLDKRIGEQNELLGEFDKAIMRSQRERQLKLSKKSKYNLSDGEEDELEIQGGLFPEKDDFDDEIPFDEDEDVDDGSTGNAKKSDILGELNFTAVQNAQQTGLAGQETRQKSKREVMEEIISKSKFFKAEKAKDKEENEQLVDQLDQEFTSLVQSEALLSLTQPNKMNALRALVNKSSSKNEEKKHDTSPALDKTATRLEKPDSYDKLVSEMALDMRARPSDRTKSAEEIAQEEKERLEQLEEERQKRMVAADELSDEEPDGSDDNDASSKQFRSLSGDDLGDSFSHEDKKTKLGWIQQILQRENAEDLGSEDAASTEESGGSEDDSEEESDEDDDEHDKTHSVKDWEQSDDDKIDTYLQDDEDSDGDRVERKKKEQEKKEKQMNLSDTESQKAIAKQQSVQQGELPYTIEAPKNLEEFTSLLENCSDDQIVEAIRRIRAFNAIHVAAENRKKMQVFYGVLLQYFAVLASKKPLNFKLLNLLVKPLMEMSAEIPYFAAICARQRLLHTRAQFSDNIKTTGKSCWPSLKTIFLLRLWSMVFPCSDFRHVVMTPAILLMCEYLMRCQVVSGRDIVVGSFLCSMVLSVTKQSRKLCPEALTFIRTLLLAAFDKIQGSADDHQLHHLMEIKTLKPLLCIKSSVKEINRLDFLMLIDLPEDSPHFNSDNFRASVIAAVAETLKGFVNLYEGFNSFPEIFLQISKVLHKLAGQHCMPEMLKDKLRDVAQFIEKKADEHHVLRQPLQMRKQKPVPIKMLNPKFEDNFVKGRDYDPDRERAERRKLKKLLKREAKGAARELRKDNYFLFEVKEKDKKLLEDERAEKYGKARAFLQEQEHAFKSGQLGKGRKRRR
ncbi:uncharacterized protein [Coffea arabica]|uniref:Uncharacterized protein isoform X1 n=1 Tax=Coffea arabica TaxID=13443 RepID=A0A6P6V2J8_COFAR|nr:nucleolar protein 14 isoform X1 [Coffea arabica]